MEFTGVFKCTIHHLFSTNALYSCMLQKCHRFCYSVGCINRSPVVTEKNGPIKLSSQQGNLLCFREAQLLQVAAFLDKASRRQYYKQCFCKAFFFSNWWQVSSGRKNLEVSKNKIRWSVIAEGYFIRKNVVNHSGSCYYCL